MRPKAHLIFAFSNPRTSARIPAILPRFRIPIRPISSVPAPPAPPSSRYPKRPPKPQHVKRTPDWLLQSPLFVAFIKGAAHLMGYNSKTSTAIRETRTPYRKCSEREEIEEKYLYSDCHLPPTYETWFQITNLHVWLLTVRYRSLPPPHGKLFVQELINHFFLNVEDRMRDLLGKKSPERIFRGYMKEYREQWTGLGLAYDLDLVTSDADLAATIWRNIFGARGERASSLATRPGDKHNGVQATTSMSDEETWLPDLPYQLYQFTAYVRRETKRLEKISDEDIMAGRIGEFGKISECVGDKIDDVSIRLEEEMRKRNSGSAQISKKRPAMATAA